MDAFISWNIMTVSIDFHGRRVGDKGVQISFVSSLQELECPQPVNHSLSQNWPRHSMWYIEIITFMKHTSLTLEHSQVIQNYIGYRGLVFLCLLMPENLEIIRKLLLKRHLPWDAHSCIHGFLEPRADDCFNETLGSLDCHHGSDLTLSDFFRDILENWPKIKSTANVRPLR